LSTERGKVEKVSRVDLFSSLLPFSRPDLIVFMTVINLVSSSSDIDASPPPQDLNEGELLTSIGLDPTFEADFPSFPSFSQSPEWIACLSNLLDSPRVSKSTLLGTLLRSFPR